MSRKIFLTLLIFLLNNVCFSQIVEKNIAIPFGSKPNIDGIMDSNEWKDAEEILISVDKEWSVKVFFKMDDSNFYFCFNNLKHNEKELYPEILLDVNGKSLNDWQEDDWWFHASYNDCEGKGNFNQWNCTKTKDGWEANNFPLTNRAVEIKISFNKINFKAEANSIIGLAFNVTDTRSLYYFWPEHARIEVPSTWGKLKLNLD